MSSNQFDFSKLSEDAITVTFPSGVTRILPSIEEPTLQAIAWCQANADEWTKLFTLEKEMTPAQMKRFDALCRKLLIALFPDVPVKAIDALQPSQGAKVIMAFTSGSPATWADEIAKSETSRPAKTQKKKSSKARPATRK